MQKLLAFVVAFGLLVGVGGTALANCGADHADTASPTSGRPPAQS